MSKQLAAIDRQKAGSYEGEKTTAIGVGDITG